MPEPKCKGLFVAAFVESAGEVSSVFERKALDILGSHGIEDPDPESLYPAESFFAAMTETEENVGRNTAKQAGEKMIEVNPEIQQMSSAEEGFGELRTQMRFGFENFSVEEVGQFDIEQLDEGLFRVATVGGWSYPEAFTEGLLSGIVKVTEDDVRNVSVEQDDTAEDEVLAYEVTW